MTRWTRVTLVSMSGLRVVDAELLELGMRMPGLARRGAALAELPPLGLLTIAATLPPWCEVSLVSDSGSEPSADAVERIMETRPDVVAFSTLTPAVDRAIAISGGLRHRGVVTVVGGLHATAAPETCEGHFDAVAVGDGETLLGRMVEDFRTGDLKGRYRARGVFDLRDSVLPQWGLWEARGEPEPEKLHSIAHRFTLQTMRGCPWACSFCAASRLLGPPRTKPDQHIASELNAIVARQRRPWIELADDNTFAGHRDHGPMLDALRNVGARWFTESDWRIGQRPDLLRAIASSGCRQILIGLESSVFRYPGMGGKNGSWQTMMDAVMAIQEAGIVVNGCFIIGADGETAASIERLGDYLETSPLGEVQLTLQTPFPGTALHQLLRQAGRLLSDDRASFSRYTLFDVVYEPIGMSVDELGREFRRLIGRVFRPEMQKRRDRMVKWIRGGRP